MIKILRQNPFLILSFWTLFSFFIAPAAQAEIKTGLAMHGAPKYDPATAPHLDYTAPDAPKGGTLKQAVTGSFDTLNPFALKGKAAEGLDPLYYDRLMVRVWDEPFTLYPLIAERIDVPEDRSALTVFINPAARFHDGTPITADDVIFSFETLKEYGRPNMRRIYRLVDQIEKRDARTVYFHFGPGYDRETVMILGLMPVLSKTWWTGRDFDSTTLEPPLSSGPYKITDIEPGRRIIYERDPNYWATDLFTSRGQFNFDRMIFDYYRDDGVAFEAFKAGEFDLRREYDAGKWATVYDFPAATEGKIVKEALSHGRPERTRGLIFNTRRAPFDDIRVREALSLALDFDWLNKNLFHGQFKRITSIFPNASLAASGRPSVEELALLEPFKTELPTAVFGPAWQPSPAPLRQNLRRAVQLLKEAGWIVENGKRVKGGQKLTFEILLRSPQDEKVALAFTRNLERLGITTQIRVLDSAAYLDRMNNYDFDMTLYYWTNSLSPGSEQMLYWSCAAADTPAQWNFPGICSPAVDALAQGMADAQSYEDLTTYAHALDRVLMAGHYMIPLYYAGQDNIAHKAPLHHPETIPLYGTVLETWWTEE